MSRGRIVAMGMLRVGTPVEDYRAEYGLWVKREDLACPPPGPPFSKTRGVYSRVLSLPEKIVGALDTYHSQAGHAVARACQILGKQAVVYYPNYKHEPGPREPQLKAQVLGAILVPLQAGRSSVIYHQAKKDCEARGGYMMPNALKLEESVEETAREARALDLRLKIKRVLIPASSGTLAAGVIRGMGTRVEYIIHLGYSRSHEQVLKYVREKSGVAAARITLIDEGYAYKDVAMKGETPPWPCNEYYDLKAFRWWLYYRKEFVGATLFWNIG
jgi:threonine dehydratase